MAKIFIIEDDMMVATLIKQALSKLDHDLTHFTNAEECIKNLHLNPDIVTVDYNLPGMNGIELMCRIKSYNAAILVVLVSGQETLDVVVESYKNGASEYIIKNDNLFVNLENA